MKGVSAANARKNRLMSIALARAETVEEAKSRAIDAADCVRIKYA